MTRFAHVLKRAEDRLRAPEPARTRILLEIAADLEDSYQHYLHEGLEEGEAARRAEEAFSTSDETLRLLERIHQPSMGSPTVQFFTGSEPSGRPRCSSFCSRSSCCSRSASLRTARFSSIRAHFCGR